MWPGLSAYPLFILSMFPRAVLSSEAYDDFLSYRFSSPTKAAFACLVQCSVRIAHPAVRNITSAGNVWHTQRDLSVLSLAHCRLIWEIIFSAAQHSDAAGTRPARPRTAIYAEGAKHARAVPSKKDRRALHFFGFTTCCRRGADTTVFIVVDAKW